MRISLLLGKDVPRSEDVVPEEDLAVLDEQCTGPGSVTGRENHAWLTWDREDVLIDKRFNIGKRLDGPDTVPEHLNSIGEELWPPKVSQIPSGWVLWMTAK